MKLSIITINRNNADGLIKTLNSVARQTWHNFEHIIIDGASTDTSVDIIQRYASEEHPYPVIWVSEPDKGIYNAMNKGILKANGEYCFFLNSGDYLIDETRFEDFLRNPFSEDIVYGFLKFDRDGILEDGCSPKDVSLLTFIEGTIHHTGNAFIRKDAFERWGLYDESLKIVSDWKWFLQAIGLSTATVQYIDMCLSIFDCNGISETQGAMMDAERREVLEAVVPNRILQGYYQLYQRLQGAQQDAANARCSRSYRIGSLILRPFRFFRTWIVRNK